MMGLNFRELPDLVRKLQKMKVDGIYFQPIEPIYNSRQTFPELKKSALWIPPKDKNEALRIVNELIALKQAGAPIINEKSNLEDLKDYFELRSEDKRIHPKKCEIDLSNLFLVPDGSISFCGTYPAIGNIKKDRIYAALSSPFATFLRKRIRNCGMIKTCMSTCKINKSLFQQARMFLMLNK